MRGFGAVFAPARRLQGNRHCLCAKHLDTGIKSKNIVYSNLIPATIFQMISTTKKMSLMRLQKDTISIQFWGRLFQFLHWFLTIGPLVGNIRDLRTVFRVREQPVYLREALLSRINPIL